MRLKDRLTLLERDIAQARRDHELLPHWERELGALRQQLRHPSIRHGIDFAWSRPHPALLRRAGINFVCRYYSGDPSKNLGRSEAEDYSQAGIDIITVWESAAQASLGGHAAGVADAKLALKESKTVGQPEHSPIFFAVDYELQSKDHGLVDGYLSGCSDVLGAHRVGVYGGLSTVTMAHLRSVAAYLWQTLAWSGTPTNWYSAAHLRQTSVNNLIAGVSCDLNVGLGYDFGQWRL